MPHRLQVQVQQLRDHRAVLVVVVAGEIGIDNRHVLWATVRKAIAECPRAVIVELSRARLVERGAVAVFAGLRQGAASHGPGVTLLLCGATDVLAEELNRVGRAGLLCRDRQEAIGAIARGRHGQRWVTRRLPMGPQAVPAAAVVVAETCRLWGMPELIPASQRAVSELVRVARWCPPREVHLSVRHQGRELVIAVRGLIAGAHEGWCPPRQLPADCHHVRTELGHITWTSLKTAAVPAYDPTWSGETS
jgi:hypothetical protein